MAEASSRHSEDLSSITDPMSPRIGSPPNSSLKLDSHKHPFFFDSIVQPEGFRAQNKSISHLKPLDQEPRSMSRRSSLLSSVRKSSIMDSLDGSDADTPGIPKKSLFAGQPKKSVVVKLLRMATTNFDEDQPSPHPIKKSSFQSREKQKDYSEMSNMELVDLAAEILKKDPENRTRKDKLALAKYAKTIEFFRKHDDETTNKCFHNMYYQAFKKHQKVFEIDSVGTTFWVILKGSVGVWLYCNKVVGINDKGEDIIHLALTEVKTLYAGSSFGELALVDDCPRQASIVCKENCEFAVLDKAHFVEILKEVEMNRLAHEMEFLVALPMFQNRHYNVIKNLYYNSSIQKYKRGKVLYEEGEVPLSMYVIKSGEVKIIKYIDTKDEEKNVTRLQRMKKVPRMKKGYELGIIGDGGIIGEEELLHGGNRKYKVVCHSLEVELCEISRTNFLDKVIRFPATRAWLNNYVTSKDIYYQTRIQSIRESMAQAKRISITSATIASMIQEDSPVIANSLPETHPEHLSMGGHQNSMRKSPLTLSLSHQALPLSPIKLLSSPALESVKSETRQFRYPSIVIDACQSGDTSPKKSTNHLHDHDKHLQEQIAALKIHETPARTSLFLKRGSKKEPSPLVKKLSNAASSQRFDTDNKQAATSQEKFIISKRKTLGSPTVIINKSHKDGEKRKYATLGKEECNLLKFSLPTEESVNTVAFAGTLENIMQTPKNNQEYGLDMPAPLEETPLPEKVPFNRLEKAKKRLSTLHDLQMDGLDHSKMSPSVIQVVYNGTITAGGCDKSKSPQRTNIRDFKPLPDNTMVKRMKQVEAAVISLNQSKPRLRKKKGLFVQGITTWTLPGLDKYHTARDKLMEKAEKIKGERDEIKVRERNLGDGFGERSQKVLKTWDVSGESKSSKGSKGMPVGMVSKGFVNGHSMNGWVVKTEEGSGSYY